MWAHDLLLLAKITYWFDVAYIPAFFGGFEKGFCVFASLPGSDSDEVVAFAAGNGVDSRYW